MARTARVVIAETPHHITQRGNRRQQTVFQPSDHVAYIQLATEAFAAADVPVWAYCLMPNHVHLVATPRRRSVGRGPARPRQGRGGGRWHCAERGVCPPFSELVVPATCRSSFVNRDGLAWPMVPQFSSFLVAVSLIAAVASSEADAVSPKSGVVGAQRPATERSSTSKSTIAASGKALVGTWRLVSSVDTPEGGEPIYAFGTQPIGQFIFTADGHASLSMMRNPPDPRGGTTDIDPDACLPAWYCSYFGTYSVAPDGSRWITHVLGGNIPSYIGTDQPRPFHIDGARLIISESYLVDGKTVHAERVLERAR